MTQVGYTITLSMFQTPKGSNADLGKNTSESRRANDDPLAMLPGDPHAAEGRRSRPLRIIQS